jgi:hypothetical protein
MPGEGYRKSDMEVVYRRGNWRSWDDIITWLQREGADDSELVGAEVEKMIEDIRHVREQHKEFVNDPAKAYEIVRGEA